MAVWTEADLVAIRAARRRGVRMVQFADRTVQYASDAEMRAVEQDIMRELNPRRPRQMFGVASKGLDNAQ